MYHVDIMQDGSILYKEGDKVALDGTSWKGTVVKVESDDNICVELDNGITMFARPELLHLCTKENTKPLHDENGKFTIGHPKVGELKKDIGLSVIIETSLWSNWLRLLRVWER